MDAEAAIAADSAALGIERSFAGRRWTMRVADEQSSRALAQSAGISLSLARLLIARGVDVAGASDYLNPTLRKFLPEPLLFKDMQRAIARVESALAAGERIGVLGDYDVDGSSSSAMLCDFFLAVGSPARLYVPDRLSEGYGPSPNALRALKEEGIALVLTVDCGATAAEALGVARDCGLDVIVLDHHAANSPVPCVAHVNPNQQDDASQQGHLSAAGVCFLFLVGLNRTLRDSGFYRRQGVVEPDLRRALDLVALATICDVVPLVGVNRAFVRTGLARASQLERPGLAALAAVAGVAPPFTAYHLSFLFGPRINAGGRIGKCSLGAELLGATERRQADEIATLLDLHNRERQEIEKSILADAIGVASLQENSAFLLAANEGWHAGVVGIVAGRLKDRFLKPTFVVGFEGGMGRGSARSVAGTDVGALVRLALEKSLIESGGGHAMAAGFSLRPSQLDAFRAFLFEQFARASESAVSRSLEIETLVSARGATPSLVEEIALAGPFGAGNPEPIVLVPDVRLAFAEIVGEEHVRMKLTSADGAWLDAIAFRVARQPLGNAILGARGRRLHAVGRLRCEEWQQRKRVQLHIEDCATAGA
jgi:single-stranded-DNA-specific exonuclease